MRYKNDKMGIIDTNSLAISPLKYETNFEPGTLELQFSTVYLPQRLYALAKSFAGVEYTLYYSPDHTTMPIVIYDDELNPYEPIDDDGIYLADKEV